ncbi:hypothetical protein JOY44_06915 [Phormidium sp. CLA17]|uniref:hypothetical protein n=1 Tax=Leptolyngbya sp. Cla-17 TaxID=2803751 RepID=UPI00149268C8|nr:hypothetical protein [Leptolyngbya sp. Cla-17]MBM0741351.1 hypothetical protein [Leptolyngbya sp. Cla-17]
MVDSANFNPSVNFLSSIGINQSSLSSALSQTSSFLTEVASEVPFISLLGSSSNLLTPSTVGALDASLVDIVNSLDEIQGTVTLANGVLVSTVSTPFGSLAETVNVTEQANNFLVTLNQIDGTLDLANGIASGNLDLGNEDFVGSFNFAQLVSSFVGEQFTTSNGTVAFKDGQIAIDLPTSLGDVEGTISFSSGQLVTDLTTPFGDVDFAIDFPENAQYTFPVGASEAMLDLNAGTIAVDVFTQIPGAEVVVPLAALSGAVDFADGIALATVVTPIGDLSFDFNVAGEVTEELAEFLTDVSGTLDIANGSLISDITSPAGAFAGTFNLSQLIADFIPQIPQYSATASFANGVVVAEGSTPYGDFDVNYDYGQYLDDVALLVGDVTA